MVEILEEIIASLQRGTQDDFKAYIETEECQNQNNGISTQIYIHTIKKDRSGEIKLEDFIERLMRACILFVIPRTRIKEAKDKDVASGTEDEIFKLNDVAKSLFSPVKNTGELGELILFVLAERYLKIPQILCKLSHKTSASVPVHGADAVHLGVSDEGISELYWGESKMETGFSSALRKCLISIKPKLIGEKNYDEDLLLIQNHLDLGDPKHTKFVKAILDKDASAFDDVAFCGICFIGFNNEAYYKETAQGKINEQKEEWEAKIHEKIITTNIKDFKIHFLCFPFKSIEEARDLFLKKLGK